MDTNTFPVCTEGTIKSKDATLYCIAPIVFRLCYYNPQLKREHTFFKSILYLQVPFWHYIKYIWNLHNTECNCMLP